MGIFDRFRRDNVNLVPYDSAWEIREELAQLAWELGMDADRHHYKLKLIVEHRRRGGAFAIYKQVSTFNGAMSRLVKVLDHIPTEDEVLSAVWDAWGGGDYWVLCHPRKVNVLVGT